MLVLFDVDGTLILTRQAGIRAMTDAARRLHGAHFTFDGVEFAGRLDPLIWHDAARANGLDDPAPHHDAFRRAYAEALAERLRRFPTSCALPGVLALLDRLAEVDGLALGLLTGNYPETGAIKLRTAGIDPARFAVAAWGCDGASRRDLPPVAIERFGAATGRRPEPQEVVIIGDTPHDVDCARAHGCIAVAVATGPAHSRAELAGCAPDLLVEDLTDADGLIAWIASQRAAPGRA
jgi:phosphoglycolate phosphatase-like HAD superfamily hydrolase